MRIIFLLMVCFTVNGCERNEYSIEQAVSGACSFKFSKRIKQLSRERDYIDDISIQGGTYSESGKLEITNAEFKELRSHLEKNLQYAATENSTETKYTRDKVKINRCYGVCVLSKNEPMVSYVLSCS